MKLTAKSPLVWTLTLLTALHLAAVAEPPAAKTPEIIQLPIAVEPDVDVEESPKDADIVIIALINEYDPEKKSEHGPHDLTPSNMLTGYLHSTRLLPNHKHAGIPQNIDWEEKIKIYVVECGTENRSKATFEKAKSTHEKLGLKDYDNTIPVIYLFHKGKIAETFTYRKSPGRSGQRLSNLVITLLSKKTD